MNRLCCCLLIALASSTALGQERVRHDDKTVVRADLESLRDLRTMLAIGGELWSESMGVGTLDFMLPLDRVPALDKAGIDYEVLIPDVQTVLDAELARLEGDEGGIAGGGFFEEYHRGDDLFDFYDALQAARPDLVTSRIIGTSVEGRSIRAYTICGSNPAERPGLYITTGVHAREWIAPATIAYAADMLVNAHGVDPRITSLVDGIAWHIVPIANPDGYEYTWDFNRLWRKNRTVNGNGTVGVDLNRNFSAGWGGPGSSGDGSSETYRGTAAFSEPEARAIRDDVASTPNLAVFFDVHCYSQLILWPYGYEASIPEGRPGEILEEIGRGIAEQIASVNGVSFSPIPASQLYLASGTTLDWAWDEENVYAFTYELRDTGQFGFVLPPDQIIPSGEEILESLLWTAEQLTSSAFTEFVSPLPQSADPFTVVDIEVKIDSIFPSVSLDPTTAVLVVNDGSRTRIPMQAGPAGSLTASFQTGACGETATISFEIETSDGILLAIESSTPGEWMIDVVEETIFYADDVETDLGWTLGLPSDDATTGIWVRADPIGTTVDGLTEYQPEDDATDPGTICFVTGQGSVGGTGGEQDIDGGSTSLLTPQIDTSGIDTAIISFAYWYRNDGGASPNADSMQVDRSNDGGSTWIPVTTIASSLSEWRTFTAEIDIDGADSIIVRFVASDLGDGSLVEAAIDDFKLSDRSCPGGSDCPEDLNGDGVVDGGDIGLLLAAWGPAAGSPADLDGNGVVSGGDLGLILAAWGPCP
ncbi:MAG: hypothetical protein GY895_22715 [Phycisphaera sp.]|nr:hypothetical protein [Phycisphaera sp.]